MASPQKERGYTPIANELLEAIYSAQLNATQLKVVLVVARYTYGFSRKKHHLSLNFIAKGTGISRRYISAALQSLITNNIITVVTKHTDTKARLLALNKNYDEWFKGGSKLLQVKDCSTGEETDNTTDEQSITTTDEQLFNQESKYLKQNLKQGDSVFSSSSKPFAAAKYLRDKIEMNHPRQPLPDMDKPENEKAQAWAREMDLLNRLGPPGGSKGYSFAEIRTLIDFATTDPFWQGNILSAQKFRQQVVRLEAQQKRPTAAREQPSPEHKRLGSDRR